MFQKILVAYNASKNSAIALREAADIARMSKGELHVLGIVVYTGGMALAETTGAVSVVAREHDRIEDALRKIEARLRELEMPFTTSIREGDPASQIIATAERIGADLVVIGHSDKGVLARWFQGTVGEKLLTGLPCGLLIVGDRNLT